MASALTASHLEQPPPGHGAGTTVPAPHPSVIAGRSAQSVRLGHQSYDTKVTQ